MDKNEVHLLSVASLVCAKSLFSLGLITGFAVGDFLSFAFPKGSKEKGTPIKPLFPHSNKIFLTKNQPDVRYALARRDFSKNFISIRAVWTGKFS
ncbi:hypothetical protein [Avibacterium volantium]|uniref:hypothetical protein n=1 Tax=Avibacterium volantium TaxID=762 RepID=UPI000F81DB1C|nr:hypothetical protein [Avibacterium volantium]